MIRLLPLLLPLLAACSGEPDIRDYYYPVRELTDGLVYEYRNTGNVNQDSSEFWYYLGVDRDTALYLSATRYDRGVTPAQVSTERVRNEGAYLQSLTLYPLLPDGERIRTDVEILYDRTFPFFPGDGLATGFRIRFPAPGTPGADNYVSLNRYYRGDTTLTVLGEEYEAVVFDLQGEVSQRDVRLGDISPTFTGYEIYARGVGLVEHYRDLGPGGEVGGKLIRRIGMEEYAAQIR
ncbi:hypothetical protein [Lewinella sp. IMCC34183]|uniref:hypothetical protein n=1 Tax=Lewinella sp. IMCC34183 TaxID=2248762 RepID=UPI000E288948|nr:hypothetical protein [Lewinella sp. IMCC34183]